VSSLRLERWTDLHTLPGLSAHSLLTEMVLSVFKRIRISFLKEYRHEKQHVKMILVKKSHKAFMSILVIAF
jgi:hypothetical protein